MFPSMMFHRHPPVPREGASCCLGHMPVKMLTLALLVIFSMLHGSHGDHHGVNCEEEVTVPGPFFLRKIKTSRLSTCSLDPRRKAPSTRMNCSSVTCCTSSDCDAADPLSWVCGCDGRCGVNRCFLVAGACGNLAPPPGGFYEREKDGFIRLRCTRGYRRVGPPKRQCKNGNWTDLTPNKCARRCRTPSTFPNSTMTLRQTSGRRLKKFYIHGDSIRGKCNPGYKLNSVKEFRMTCKHGRWRPGPDQLECIEDADNPCCSLPTTPANGGVHFLSGHNETLCRGQAFSYYCDQCYQLSAGLAQDVCVRRDQVFNTPQCTRVSCSIKDIPVPAGAYVSQDIADENARYDCQATVTLRCQGIHDTFSSSVRQMQCHSNGSWVVPAWDQPLQCTPSAVRGIRVEETSATSLRLSWLSPLILPNFTSRYEIIATQVNILAGRRQHKQTLSIPSTDDRRMANGRFHVTINNLLPAIQCEIKITSVSNDGIHGGMQDFEATTNAQDIGPFHCESRGQRLFAIWQGSSFAENGTFQVSYMTTETVTQPYRARRTFQADNVTELYLAGIQPFTDFNVKLEVSSFMGQEEHGINCTLMSDTIAPRPPPPPDVREENDNFVVVIRPSPDLFVEQYTLVIRKKSFQNVIQDSRKYDFTAEDVRPTTGTRTGPFEFIIPDLRRSPEGRESFDFVVLAATPLNIKRGSKKVVYMT